MRKFYQQSPLIDSNYLHKLPLTNKFPLDKDPAIKQAQLLKQGRISTLSRSTLPQLKNINFNLLLNIRDYLHAPSVVDRDEFDRLEWQAIDSETPIHRAISKALENVWQEYGTDTRPERDFRLSFPIPVGPLFQILDLATLKNYHLNDVRYLLSQLTNRVNHIANIAQNTHPMVPISKLLRARTLTQVNRWLDEDSDTFRLQVQWREYVNYLVNKLAPNRVMPEWTCNFLRRIILDSGLENFDPLILSSNYYKALQLYQNTSYPPDLIAEHFQERANATVQACWDDIVRLGNYGAAPEIRESIKNHVTPLVYEYGILSRRDYLYFDLYGYPESKANRPGPKNIRKSSGILLANSQDEGLDRELLEEKLPLPIPGYEKNIDSLPADIRSGRINARIGHRMAWVQYLTRAQLKAIDRLRDERLAASYSELSPDIYRQYKLEEEDEMVAEVVHRLRSLARGVDEPTPEDLQLLTPLDIRLYFHFYMADGTRKHPYIMPVPVDGLTAAPLKRPPGFKLERTAKSYISPTSTSISLLDLILGG